MTDQPAAEPSFEEQPPADSPPAELPPNGPVTPVVEPGAADQGALVELGEAEPWPMPSDQPPPPRQPWPTG